MSSAGPKWRTVGDCHPPCEPCLVWLHHEGGTEADMQVMEPHPRKCVWTTMAGDPPIAMGRSDRWIPVAALAQIETR